MISIVCPFYNEEAIIANSVKLMLGKLSTLEEPWELIIVNDGSTDASWDAVKDISTQEPRLKVIGYDVNRGRGYAIRAGAAAACGELLVTTEIDSSWGDDIVHRLVAEMKAHEDTDMVIASVFLPGGGYGNIPFHRIFLSTLGNLIIRSSMSCKITMNTGMTRAYRRDKFLNLPLDEDGKEMHLEVISKAVAFGYIIKEIPATLEWKTDSLSAPDAPIRKSSSKIPKLIKSHLLFSLMESPARYIYSVAGLVGISAVGFLGWALTNLIAGKPSIFLLITSLILIVFSFLIVALGILALQNKDLQSDMWRLRSDLNRLSETHNNDSVR